MIEVDSTPESCTIAVSYPGVRTTLTMSPGDAVKLMEKIGYNYGYGPEPRDRGADPLDEALKQIPVTDTPKKRGILWRIFRG